MLPKKLLVILVVVLVVLVAVGVWVGLKLASKDDGTSPSEYSMVMLSNGEVYFGKLSWFPRPRLENAWALQRAVDENNQVQISVNPVNRAFWGQTDFLYLNPREIISWAPLLENSELVKGMKDPASLQQNQGGLPAGGATSTFQGPETSPPGQ